jgi:hypothetical protein
MQFCFFGNPATAALVARRVVKRMMNTPDGVVGDVESTSP